MDLNLAACLSNNMASKELPLVMQWAIPANVIANVRLWLQADIQSPEIEVCSTPNNGHSGQGWECLKLSSRPGESHPQALPEPCVNLSIHTAHDVPPLTCID